MKIVLAALSALTLLVTPALAAPCRDAKGHFTKCPEKPGGKPKRCKDARGKFASCDAPGAKPVK